MDPAAASPPSASSLPRTLGEFRIEAILGEGGSGIVYDATWGPRRVALKVLHPSLADTDRVRAQFFSEAQRLQTLAHPGVVKVLAVGELPDRRPYLAMERLDGETLASVLARGPVPLAQALELFGELCGAVATLHDQGLIHRDLKPENVFIVGGAHAVLLDFGIAKELAAPASTTTIDGGVRGTPAYMAPERFFGQPASIATDVYELAVTLYAMIAGRLPWDDLADPEARLSPRPLVELVDVPAELDVELRRALSTRAQNRPASATALHEAVRATAGADAPRPAETARMRPATDAPPPAARPTTTGVRTPWEASPSNASGDRGKTPLAWTPDAAPAPVAAPPARRRWPRWVAAGALVAIAGGVVAWRLGARASEAPADANKSVGAPSVMAAASTAPPAASSATAPDPWGDHPPPRPTPQIPTSGPELPAATARAEAARAISHLPADTQVIAAVLVGPLRRDPRFAPLFDKLARHPKLAGLGALVPPCVSSLIAGSEWFVFGAQSFTSQEQGTLIVRGRWQRADVEACFAQTSERREMTDGARMLALPELGWIDFLDDHTVYLSVRQDLTAAQVHAAVKRPIGPTKRARTLLGALPADRAITFVVDGANKLGWPGDPLPAGTDAAGWLRGDPDAVTFDVALDVKAEAEAKALEASLTKEVGPVFAGASPQVGKLEVRRTRTTVRLTGALSSMMMSIVASAI